MKRYSVVEIFATLQGEGGQAGTPSVFVRFTGCNLWAGTEDSRERDAGRHGARCPRFCDTDFRRGNKLDLDGVVQRVSAAATDSGMPNIPLIVFTGGEPLLQLDADLASALAERTGARLAIETNGSIEVAADLAPVLDWICVSPKQPAEKIRQRSGQELKVVVPAYDPLEYQPLASGFEHLFVQPEARTTGVGHSELDAAATRAAIDFCHAHPAWRLSLQTHKILGLD